MRGTKTALSSSPELKGRESAWCLSLLCMSSPQWKRRSRVRWGVEESRG